MRKVYQSDITRERFERGKYLLEVKERATNRLVYDLYDIFCAILYVLKNEGCTWRGLPHDFPKWQKVEPKTTMIIVDSKSIKNTDTAYKRGYDSGKKCRALNRVLA